MLLTKTVAAVATGVLTTGGAAFGVGSLHHTDTAEAATTNTSSPTTLHCGHGGKKASPQLRAALKRARQQPAGKARRKALAQVEAKALHGDYGSLAEKQAVRQIKQRAFLRGTFPEKLRTDLRAIHKLPAGQRQAAHKAIWAKVRAGDYGQEVQQRIQKKKEHREQCRAQRQERKEKKDA